MTKQYKTITVKTNHYSEVLINAIRDTENGTDI